MCQNSDVCVAFSDGRGTTDMVHQCLGAGILVPIPGKLAEFSLAALTHK